MLKTRRLRWKIGKQASYKKTGGEAPTDRPKVRFEDNIIWDLKEVGYEGDWKALAQYRVICRAYVLTAMNHQIP